MSLSVTIDTSRLRSKLEKMKTINTESLMAEIGFVVEGFIKDEITEQGLIKTGAYRASVFNWVEGNTAFIASGVKYANWLERGTDPYIIRPKSRKSLKFDAGGTTVFSKVVHHPGIPAFHPFSKGLKKSIPTVVERVKMRIRRAA